MSVPAHSNKIDHQARRLAHAIRHGARRVVERKARQVFQGQVTALNPFRCTIHTLDLTLDADDVTFSQDIERYDAGEGVVVGDNLALMLVTEGEWLAISVLSDTPIWDVQDPSKPWPIPDTPLP